MEWFQSALERRNKSVVGNARTAVSNMADMMQKQNSRLNKLESVVKDFETLALDSLQGEINAMEKRKRELVLELETLDLTLTNRRQKLEHAKTAIADLNSIFPEVEGGGAQSTMGLSGGAGAGAPSSSQHHRARTSSGSSIGSSGSHGRGMNGGGGGRSTAITATSHNQGGADGSGAVFSLSVVPRPSPDHDELEMDYMEEIEMLDSIREVVAPSHVLFVVQRSDVDELLLYQPSASMSQVVMTTRIQDDSGRVPPTSVTHAEAKLGLEARIIPNHEREYPDVMSMALPQFVEPTLREYLSRVSRKRVGQGSMSEGELVGSIEIPCIEEVVVDVWRTDGWTWATTTVSDVKFSVLERLVITCDFSHGSNHVSSIDLFARHPVSGHIVEENILRIPSEAL